VCGATSTQPRATSKYNKHFTELNPKDFQGTFWKAVVLSGNKVSFWHEEHVKGIDKNKKIKLHALFTLTLTN
jgi:hypothetical protein